MMTKRHANKQCGRFIASRSEFTNNNGTFAGRPTDGYYITMGRLSDDTMRLYMLADPSYVVSSYETPIAWWSEDQGWCIPPDSYSVTTRQHQSIVIDAVDGVYETAIVRPTIKTGVQS